MTEGVPGTLGRRIRAVRAAVDQAHFAGSIEVSVNSLSRYENDKSSPDVAALCRLAELYKVDLNWLLLGRGKMKTDTFDTAPEREHPHAAELGDAPPFSAPATIEDGAMSEAVALLRELSTREHLALSTTDEGLILARLYRTARRTPDPDQRRRDMEAVFHVLAFGRLPRRGVGTKGADNA